MNGRRFADTRGSSLKRRVRRSTRTILDRFSLLLSDEVVVETQALVGELNDLVGGKPVHVVPYGLSPPVESPPPSGSPAQLLYVGTPGLRKRTHLLPVMLAHVREAIPDASLRIVGFDSDGDLRLMNEARRLGLSHAIHFEGAMASEQAQRFYSIGEVLVLPSSYEGLPMVLLEAMRAELPTVATAVSGHPEAITDGVDGYLVPLDAPTMMADRCVELLIDDELRRAVGQAAAATVRKRFSVENQLSAYMRVYHRLAIGSALLNENSFDGF